MNRRLVLRKRDLPSKYRKVHVNVRMSKESYTMLVMLSKKYPGLYANKSHCVECALRRLFILHRKNKIEVFR